MVKRKDHKLDKQERAIPRIDDRNTLELLQVQCDQLEDGKWRVELSVLSHPAVMIATVRARVKKQIFELEKVSSSVLERLRYTATLPQELHGDRVWLTATFHRGASITKSIDLVDKKTARRAGSRFAERRKLGDMVVRLWMGRKTLVENAKSVFWRVFLRRAWIPWVRSILRCKPIMYFIQNPERIGHLASEPEIFFSEASLKYHGGRVRFCFVLLRDSFVEGVGMVRTQERIRSFYLTRLLSRRHFVVWMNRADFMSLPYETKHRLRQHAQRDIRGVLDRTKPGLSFSRSEVRRGWRELERLGIEDDMPYVCLHLRESGYIKQLYEGHQPPEERYAYRDVEAESYRRAIDYLTGRGVRVVRMGVPPVAPFPSEDPMVIDYANRGQSSFLDLFLCAHCEFFVGTTSGLYAVAELFRKPMVLTNFAPLRHIHSWSSKNLIVPKLAFHRRLSRHLTFEEMLLRGFGDIIHGEKFSQLGIDYVPNTSEEILRAVAEMLDRVLGRWCTTARDEALQNAFWSLIERDEFNWVIRARVSSFFLREHADLLSRPMALTLPKH